jgi:hypothetical protein
MAATAMPATAPVASFLEEMGVEEELELEEELEEVPEGWWVLEEEALWGC